MFILETEQSFDAAHFLSGYAGKCRNIHGHRWRVIARIADSSLSKDTQTRDMLIDFGDFKDILAEMTGQLDHTLIIETGSLMPETLAALEKEGFAVTQFPFRPTAERLAEYFFKEFRQRSCPVISVSVYETPGNSATYQEDIR